MNRYQSLINECLTDTRHVENAALLKSCASTHVTVAASARFKISVHQQGETLADSFKDLTATRAQGISFQGKAYTCVKADKNSVYCKWGQHGLILVKTVQNVVVATYDDNMYPSVCVEAAEKLGEYLRVKGK